MADAPTEDRFIKYLPAYSPDKAYKHFIKNQKTAKPDGWLEVPIIPNNYLDTQFVIQVKGNDLLPLYDSDTWIILNHTKDYTNATNNLCLVHHKSINDNYDENCTIRKMIVSQHIPKGSFLPVAEVQLLSLSNSVPPIKITNISGISEISIVGIIEIPPN